MFVGHAAVAFASKRASPRFGVLSHWLLDAATHAPDLPLWPGGPRLGLGLWNSLPATLLVEGAMFVAAVGLYLSSTRARSAWGHVSLWSFLALFTAAYAGALFGPPPPSAQAVAWTGIASWLFLPWAAWIERTRPTTRP